ncbi:hypothetical protein CAP39_06035 [Sphingomonas sp. IBVSS1]|nr:hypothetical protein CAP39_06035 [Sphingomonas sp. IBVSS1]
MAFDGGSPGAGWFSDGQILVGVGNPDGSGKSGPSFAGGYDPFWSSNSGGFGGGGSGNPFGDLHQPGYGGGGGGGYTGGNGAGDYGGGFAGTSYVASFALSSSFAAGRSGDGFVQIAAVPEPASWALLIIGFGAVGGTLRARRLRPA